MRTHSRIPFFRTAAAAALFSVLFLSTCFAQNKAADKVAANPAQPKIRTITAFIRECRDLGKTVIFSTHIMSEVEKLCDVIGIIQNGKLLAEGSLQQLREKYDEQDLEEIFVKVVAPHYVSSEDH